MSSEVRILEPGHIESPAGQVRFLIPAGRDVFARRAERFRHLSQGHPMKDYLGFLALLADAQQMVLSQFPTLSLPDTDAQELCREHGMPLLAARSWTRNPCWRGGLTIILQKMSEADLPPTASKTVSGLIQESGTWFEEMADRIVAGDLADIPPQELPFVAAALQVYWVHMASTLGEDAFGRLEQGGACPVCGSFPNAGIVYDRGAEQGLRYLCCSLCSSRWHMVRIKCSCCESTQRINLYTLEGSNGAVKAESCDDCNSYLKMLYLEKDRQMDSMADDLVTLTLDMLMDKEGKSRCGPNLFYHSGML